MTSGSFLKNTPFLKNLMIYIYLQYIWFGPKEKKIPIQIQKMPHVSLTSTELMLIGVLIYEQKIFTIPHVSPLLDHSSSTLDILPDFSPSHQNYMRSRELESEALYTNWVGLLLPPSFLRVSLYV